MKVLDGLASAAALVELHGDPFLEILDAVAADAELYQVKGHAGDLEPAEPRINAVASYAQASGRVRLSGLEALLNAQAEIDPKRDAALAMKAFDILGEKSAPPFAVRNSPRHI
jgi:hypothetical protein